MGRYLIAPEWLEGRLVNVPLPVLIHSSVNGLDVHCLHPWQHLTFIAAGSAQTGASAFCALCRRYTCKHHADTLR